ncbi:MAG: hypothetical protein O2856_08405, partial [Planctomycetota bacterium]|nr:hypothetical protein [Planctomycetota bacterium]
MKKSIENLRQKIKAWLAQEQRARRRKLLVVRLEDRRLPDASFGMLGGILALDGFDLGDTLTVEGDLTGGEGGTFTLLTGKWDAFDSDLLTGPFSLSNMNHTLNLGPATVDALHISAVDPLTAINTSPTGVQVGSLQIAGGGAVDLTGINTDFDTISITADSLSLIDVDDVEITHLKTTGGATIVAGSDITDVADLDGTTIDIGGHASFSATNITLGDHSLDHTYFHSLSFVATGDVEITEDDSMTVSDASSGHHVTLVSSDDVTLDGMIHATGDVSITAGTTTGGIDVNAELSATGSILLNAADEITIDAEIDSVSVTLEADDDITINAPMAATDLITISAGRDGSGSVFLNLSGSLTANNADDTADVIINSGATSGAVTLDGIVTADDLVGITAVGSIKGSGLITATNLSLAAGSAGIGTSGAPLMFDALNLNATTTGNGNQFLSELNSATINATGLNAGSGTITLSSGMFILGASERINNSAKVNVSGGATLDLGRYAETISQLILSEGNVAGAGTLTGSNLFDVRSGSISAVLAGSVGLTKTTAGSVTLNGVNTYTGTTTINGGTLLVAATGSIASAITVTTGILDVAGIISNTVTLNGGTLRGTGGTINGAVTVKAGASLSPGNSPGILSTGNLNFNNNSTFTVEIQDGNASGGVAGTDYDQVKVTGTVVIGTNVTLNLQDLGSTQANPRDVYTIIDNDGTADAVTGTFAGLPNGAFVTAVGGINYRIYYNGGDGNDVVLIGRPSTVPVVYVSNSFIQTPGTVITDVDFITVGNQPGVYGIDAFLTIAEGISGVDSSGTIHVDAGTFIHNGTLQVNKSVTIDGQGMTLTEIRKSGAPTGNFDEAIRITADNVTISDVQLGWVDFTSNDYQGYVVLTQGDHTTISHVQFGESFGGDPTLDDGYRSAIVIDGAHSLEVSDSIFEGRWGRAAIRDSTNGSGENFLITRNEFREDHFRWGPIAIGPQGTFGDPNNFAFSGEISFNYFGNGLDALDFQSGGDQNYTVTITNQGLTTAGLKILHNTFDWNDSNVTNQNGVYAQPTGVYITPSLTNNTDQILIQDNIFNNFA